MHEIDKLLDRLAKIEALYVGAATDGERAAAGNARERIKVRLRELHTVDPPTEFRFRMDDPWSRKLFLALLRRYGILPYRYKGQRLTTVMARIPPSFVAETLWPHFSSLDSELQSLIRRMTDDVIRRAIFSDTSEAGEVDHRGAKGTGPNGKDPTAREPNRRGPSRERS